MLGEASGTPLPSDQAALYENNIWAMAKCG
jgi:hypothetical protein